MLPYPSNLLTRPSTGVVATLVDNSTVELPRAVLLLLVILAVDTSQGVAVHARVNDHEPRVMPFLLRINGLDPDLLQYGTQARQHQQKFEYCFYHYYSTDN